MFRAYLGPSSGGRLQLTCGGTRRRTGGGEWSGNWRIEWLASTLHTTSEHGVSSITTADATPRLSVIDWTDAPPPRFKWTHPSSWKTKSGFCACAATFQNQSNKLDRHVYRFVSPYPPSQSVTSVHTNSYSLLQLFFYSVTPGRK
jgi:hypothetical protein